MIQSLMANDLSNHAYIIEPPQNPLNYRVWRVSGLLKTSLCQRIDTSQIPRGQKLQRSSASQTLPSVPFHLAFYFCHSYKQVIVNKQHQKKSPQIWKTQIVLRSSVLWVFGLFAMYIFLIITFNVSIFQIIFTAVREDYLQLLVCRLPIIL